GLATAIPMSAAASETLLQSGIQQSATNFDQALTRAIAGGLDPVSADQLMWRYDQVMHPAPTSWWKTPLRDHQRLDRLATLQADLDAAFARSRSEQRDGFVRTLHVWSQLVIEAHQGGVTTDGLDDTQARFAHYATLAITPNDFSTLSHVLGDQLLILQDRLSEFRSARTASSVSLASARSLLATAEQYPELDLAAFGRQITAAAAQIPDIHSSAGFAPVEDQLTQVALGLQGLLDARAGAYAQLNDARATLATARADGLPVADPAGAIASLAWQLESAANTLTFQSLASQLSQQKQVLAAAIWSKENQLTWNAGAGKLIVISLSRQVLTAFQDGTPVLTTYVTTGRPWLPTTPGVTAVTAKYSPFLFVSPWAYGSDAWYPPSWTTWAMLFRGGGYFIHDAPWRTWYGPGSNTGAGTHGCVNVPYGPMSILSGWTTIGTTVVVTW
ncbi:MAG TPA: L,D-transpeptidase, partial [Candidatus Dormibacteraeota bacterium]|nr:L,D-transpeptidase [Candidatus Dormibacteraeota bacterium]